MISLRRIKNCRSWNCICPNKSNDDKNILSSLTVVVGSEDVGSTSEQNLSASAWTLKDARCDGRTDNNINGSRLLSLSSVLDCPQQSPATSPSKDSGRSYLKLDESLKKMGKLAHFSHRASIREKSSSHDNRKRALRQRSMSLDAAEELWSNAAACVAAKQTETKSPTLIIGSSNFRNKSAKNHGSSEITPKRSYRMTGSSKKNRKSNRGGSELDGDRSRKKHLPTNMSTLFEAVEKQNLEQVREILQNANAIDVNSTNSDDFTLLDVALLINHAPLAQLLIHHGARENPKYQKSVKVLEKKLEELCKNAESKVTELRGELSAMAHGGNNVFLGSPKDHESFLNHWEFREKVFSRMKAVFENAECPSEPTNVLLSVASNSSLLVTFNEPAHHNGSLVTRYKVEWSCYESFMPLVGEQIIDDPQFNQYEILDLVQGNAYYVRVSAWNVKGYGPWASSVPAFGTPSNWKELDDSRVRWDGKLNCLDELFVNIRNSRSEDSPEIEVEHLSSLSLYAPNRKSSVKKSIKSLFSSAPKFQKTLKRGIYLAAVVCTGDRFLTTSEEMIPIIEVDENFLNDITLLTEYYWLMKVACTWKDVKSLRQDLERNSSPGIMQFRSRLLQAISQLQSGIGLQDLGQFYHQPIKDANGSIILTTVKCHNSTKSVNISQHVKWTPLNKIQRRSNGQADNERTAVDILMDTANELVSFHRSSFMPLPKGLYLGYLKLQSTMEQMYIMVPQAVPNVLPHIKVRDCPNVTRDEWEWIRSLSSSKVPNPASIPQKSFQNNLLEACTQLMHDLEIGEEDLLIHRLYDMEVIEISSDVSFILILPSAQKVCSIPGEADETNQKYLMLPVQAFEMIHMRTYQFDLISRYSRLSSILPIDLHLASQASRNAYTTEEIKSTRHRVHQLTQFQQKLDEAWKAMKWTMDIMTYARDKSTNGGLPLSVLFATRPDNSPATCRDVVTLSADDALSTDNRSSSSSDRGYHSDLIEGQGQCEITCATSAEKCETSEEKCETMEDKCSVFPENSTYENVTATETPPLGILRVYSTCDGKGPSIKLHVTPHTTAKEIVCLAVQQLTKASQCRLNVSGESDPNCFCLVLTVGPREHVLRDDFQPLLLQNPWTKGRLFVRIKRINSDTAAGTSDQITDCTKPI